MNPPRVLVFAHQPPPHHGQSQMVKFLVDGLRDGSRGVDILHVDARVSGSSEDIGRPRLGKVFALLGYVVQAWWARLAQGARVFYYVPSPAKRATLYRDWIVLGLCRWCYPRLVLHWHAVGLGAWLQHEARPWERWITRCLLFRADLSLSLSEMTASDASHLRPRRAVVVPNGIVDPAPEFEQALGGMRRRRFTDLQKALRNQGAPSQITVLYLALCSRDKGVFDAFNAVVRANQQLEKLKSGARFRLVVAGEFVLPEDRVEFDRLNAVHSIAERQGFLNGGAKAAIFTQADVFLFPTYYANEGQPLNLVEAMAWGLPVVTTRWRGVPEILPPGYPGIVEPRDLEGLASALVHSFDEDHSMALRARYLARFTLEQHLDTLAKALRSVH